MKNRRMGSSATPSASARRILPGWQKISGMPDAKAPFCLPALPAAGSVPSVGGR